MPKPNSIGLINESVYTSDDGYTGDIYAINKEFYRREKRVCEFTLLLPISKVKGRDGNVLFA